MNPRYERWRRQTFVITWLIYACFYLTRQSFSVAKVAMPLDSSLALTRDDFGLIDSTYLTLYMVGQFFFGPLGDRFGPRRILLFGLGLSVAAAVGFGMSTALTAFLLFSALQGAAQSTGWSGTNKAMSSWFSVNERGRVLGWWCTHYTIGPAIALPFAGWLMQHYGHTTSGGEVVPYWPAAFWGPAAVLSAVLVLTWLLLRNKPEDVGLSSIEVYHDDSQPLSNEDKAIVKTSEGSWELIAAVLGSVRIWALAVAYFSVKLVRYVFIFWGPKYAAETLHSDALASSIVAAAMPVGGFVGVIAAGYVSDKLFQSRRAPAAIISLLACAAVMTIGLFEVESAWFMAVFFFLAGAFLFGPDSMISSTASIDFGTKRGAGTAVGFVNGIGSLGGILAGWLPGKITTGTNWAPLFAVMLVGLVVSAIVLMPLWRAKPSTD